MLIIPTQPTQGGVRLNNVTTVVETGKSEDGTQWYRLWSDGWCEQGGLYDKGSTSISTENIELLKPFSSQQYSITLTDVRPTATNVYIFGVIDRQSTYFTSKFVAMGEIFKFYAGFTPCYLS